MNDLLLLVHRIPYPPNKGDKIRSFHLLQYLSQHYRIHLATFIDQPSDHQYIDVVQRYCTSVWFGALSPHRSKVNSLIGFFTGEPLTLPYYRCHALTHWIEKKCAQYQIKKVLIYSSAMAQYVLGSDFSEMRRIVDFVDVDSDKWQQYSTAKRFPMNWIYRREAVRLSKFEQKIARCFDASIFVSNAEVSLFKQKIGDNIKPATYAISNGVDVDYFSQNTAHQSPFQNTKHHLVFTGAMDYWANIEGAEWFAKNVLPIVRQSFPFCAFYIVGMNPTHAVRQLENLPGVIVTGCVPDVRPYLQHAHAIVVPLRIARGIQNKVLEAMAMERPVVTTPQALEGIPARIGSEVCVATDAAAFAEQVVHILNENNPQLGIAARNFVQTHFSWTANLPKFTELLEVQP